MSEIQHHTATAFAEGEGWTVRLSSPSADPRALDAWVQWLAEELGGEAAVGSTELRVRSRGEAERATRTLGWAAAQVDAGEPGFVLLGRAASGALPTEDLDEWLLTLLDVPEEGPQTSSAGNAAAGRDAGPDAGRDAERDAASAVPEGDADSDAPIRQTGVTTGVPEASDLGSSASPPPAPAFDTSSAPLPASSASGRWSVYVAAPGPDPARTLRLLEIGAQERSAMGADVSPERLEGVLVMRDAAAPDVRRLHTLVSTAAGATLHLEAQDEER